MTRSVKAVFLFLCAMTLLLLTASAMLAESPPPPKIISVTPNADGSALVVVQGGNNFMPSEGPPAGWFEFYPRYGPNPASGTGPFDANHGNLYTVPNHSAILSVVSYDPANNTTTYRLSLQQGDLANNAQIGDQVTMVITQCVGSDDNQSGPSNAVTITVGDPNTAYSEDSEPGNTETPGPTPDPTPEPTPVPTPEPTPDPSPMVVITPNPTAKPSSEEHEHVWTWASGRKPSCTKDGYEKFQFCKICKISQQRLKKLPALGHNFGPWQPTVNGMHARVCRSAGCGHIESGNCLWATDEYGKEVFAAQDGKRYRICALCGQEQEVEGTYSLIEQENQHKHIWEQKPGRAPSCTSPGYTSYRVCIECGAEEGKEFLAVSHEWGEWTSHGTNMTSDRATYYHDRKCQRCGRLEKEGCTWRKDAEGEIDSVPIDIDLEVIDLVEGEMVSRHLRGPHYCKVCTVCGNAIPYPKDGGAYAVEEAIKTREHDHQWVDVSRRLPTCKDSGYTAHQYCSICGLIQHFQPLSAMGHDFGPWRPTVNRKHARVCRAAGCGEIEIGNCVWATDEHYRYVLIEHDGKMYYTCTECKQEQSLEDFYLLGGGVWTTRTR